MIYPSWCVARALVTGLDTRSRAGLTAQASVAARVMTAWDVVMDPGMAKAGNWVREQGGAYFGVPRRNYLGWLLTTFLVYLAAGWLWRNTKQSLAVRGRFALLPVVVYAFFAVRYLTPNRIPELQVVAIFSMGMPALLSLIQVSLRRDAARSENRNS